MPENDIVHVKSFEKQKVGKRQFHRGTNLAKPDAREILVCFFGYSIGKTQGKK